MTGAIVISFVFVGVDYLGFFHLLFFLGHILKWTLFVGVWFLFSSHGFFFFHLFHKKNKRDSWTRTVYLLWCFVMFRAERQLFLIVGIFLLMGFLLVGWE